MTPNKRKKSVSEEKESIINILQESYIDTNNLQTTIKKERIKMLKMIGSKEDANFLGKYVSDLIRHEGASIDRKLKIVDTLNQIRKGDIPNESDVKDNDKTLREIAMQALKNNNQK